MRVVEEGPVEYVIGFQSSFAEIQRGAWRASVRVIKET